MSENRASCLTYYMHDEAAAFRFQLAGGLSKDSTTDLDQARETASSVLGRRPLIVDLTGIESIDTAGRQLIEKWHGRGALFVVTTPQAKIRIQSMTGVPFCLIEKNRDRSEWLPGRLLRWLLAAVFRVFVGGSRHGNALRRRFLRGWTKRALYFTRGAIAMKTLKQVRHGAADLHWLAFLLTGRREIAFDVTAKTIDLTDGRNGFFSTWMVSWSRSLVIARALAAVRDDLARSARRTALSHTENSEFPEPSWVLDVGTSKSDLEHALLQIDLFPRAAVLLLVFERVPLKDAAILLDSEADLVKKAVAAGVRDLTIKLARTQGWTTASSATTRETQHA